MRRVWNRAAVAMVAGAVSYSFTSVRAMAADAGEDLKLLRQELAKQRAYVEQLEKRFEAQEAKLASKEKADAVEKAKAPSIEAGYDDGFYIRSKDKPFSLVATGSRSSVTRSISRTTVDTTRTSMSAWRAWRSRVTSSIPS